jgi:hypothetical protein
MKRTALAAFVILAAAVLFSGSAHAKPGYGACTGCHNADSAVTLTATDQGCTGGNASYRLTVSTPHNWKQAWAVFNSAGTNVSNGSNFPANVALAEGSTYTIYAVTNKPGQPGTDSVTVTPSCASPPPPPPKTCTDADSDGYFAESGCGTAVDCNDGDAGINPGAAEACGDGTDNNCSGTVDEGCTEPAVETLIALIDDSGFVVASEAAGGCGKASFYDVPAGNYFVEVTREDTHFAKLKFAVPDVKSPARVVVKAETEDDDDAATLEVEVDVASMSDSEKVAVRKLGGNTKWSLSWVNGDEDFIVYITGNGVVNLDRVSIETEYGTLDAYRIDVKDKRHKAEALFRQSDLVKTLTSTAAEAGDKMRARLSLVTPANEKNYKFSVHITE